MARVGPLIHSCISPHLSPCCSPCLTLSLQGYVLVYSITDDTTFAKLDKVRDEIMRAQAGKRVPIFLVGTKKDLAKDRAVSEKEREAKARMWGVQSYEISSMTNEGVTEVFERMAEDIIASNADGSKGTGGGSVLGAGKATQTELLPPKRKTCTFL